jgi:hypothetical protein
MQQMRTLAKSGKSSIPQVKHRQLRVSSSGKLLTTYGGVACGLLSEPVLQQMDDKEAKHVR